MKTSPIGGILEMQSQTNKKVFDISSELLKDFKFGQSLKVAQAGAKQYRLYDAYRSDFATIRVLAFENKDWAQAAFYLSRLLAKLSDEVRSMQK